MEVPGRDQYIVTARFSACLLALPWAGGTLRSVTGDTGANNFVQSVAQPAQLLLQMHDAHLRREGV